MSMNVQVRPIYTPRRMRRLRWCPLWLAPFHVGTDWLHLVWPVDS
jgi:hypothetical protein